MDNRELDNLVKKQVFGWELRQVGNGSMDGEYYWHDGNDFVTREESDSEPSTDISAAFEVVEKLIELDLWIQMEMSGKVWWACNFWNCKTGVHGEIVHEKTAPLAICLAALSLEART